MKLKSFSNAALNVGFMDVQLLEPTKLDHICCTTCGFAAPEVLMCQCAHVYCGNCLLVLDESDDDAQGVMAHCGSCECRVSYMKIELDEAFLKHLQCLCPYCKLIVRVGELKGHLKCCIPLKAFASPPVIELASDPGCSPKAETISPEATNNFASSSHPSATAEEPVRACPMMNTAPRELLDRVAIQDNAVHESLNAAQEKLDALQVVRSPETEIIRTYELMLREGGERETGLRMYIAYITIGDTVFLFRTYSGTRNVHMWVTAVGDCQPYRAFEVTVSRSDERNPKTRRIDSVRVGKRVTFERVLKDFPCDATVIKVKLKLEYISQESCTS